jgi:nucleoside-diphosphate-sugar epimerase
MKRALVTGATGFIGSHLTRRLVRRGAEVHVLCRRASDFWRLADVRGRLIAHVVDLRDRRALRRVATSIRPHDVFHMAAAAMHGGVAAPPTEIVATTLLGTVNLVDACDPVAYRCFVHTGDAFEYAPRRRPLRPSDTGRPRTFEGAVKLVATWYAQRAAGERGRPIAVIRPFSVFGPADDARRLMSRLVAAARAAAPMALSARGVARDWLYVDDLVDLYLAVARRPERTRGRILNGGTGRLTTLAELVADLERLVGRRCVARWGTYPLAPHDRLRWQADISDTVSTCAWRPRTTVARGLEAIVRKP